jgi:PAS domain S-box-containing protein
MSISKINLIAVSSGFFVGAVMIVLSILLVDVIEDIERKEIHAMREIITKLIQEALYLDGRNFGTISTALNGFYLASEYVTDEEFVAFAGNIMKNAAGLENILVYNGSSTLNSYPMAFTHALTPSLLEPLMSHNGTRYVVLMSKESDISTALFVDPTKIVNLDDILSESAKAVLYVNGERFPLKNKHGLSTSEFTSDEILKALQVSGSIQTDNTRNAVHLDYLVYQTNFEAEIDSLKPLILLGGVVVGCFISVLTYMEIKTRYRLKIKNKELQTNAGILKKTESLLLESEERYRNLFELSPVPVATIGIDGKIKYSNSRADDLFGYDKNEVVGMDFVNFVSESDVALSQDLFRTVLSSGNMHDVNIQCKKKDGKKFNVKINANTFTDKNAKAVGVLVVITPLE